MLCEKCKKKEATTHIKRIINGDFSEYHLCSECANDENLSPFGNSITADINSMLGSFLGMAGGTLANTKRCPVCSSSYNDIVKNSVVGCENCYKIFYRELLPTIKRIHGNTSHCGKRLSMDNQSAEDNIQSLREQLGDAVAKQEFERAAELRDKIRELDSKA